MDDSGESNHDDDGGADVPHLISNLAVLEMLKPRVEIRGPSSGRNRKATAAATNRRLNHRNWIEGQVVDYIQGSDCTQFVSESNAAALYKVLRSNKKRALPAGNQNGALCKPGFDLTDAESLQILNLSPTEPVEIHLLVDELQDRMTTAQQEDLLATLQQYRTVATTAVDCEMNGDGPHHDANAVMNGSHGDQKPAALK